MGIQVRGAVLLAEADPAEHHTVPPAWSPPTARMPVLDAGTPPRATLATGKEGDGMSRMSRKSREGHFKPSRGETSSERCVPGLPGCAAVAAAWALLVPEGGALPATVPPGATISLAGPPWIGPLRSATLARPGPAAYIRVSREGGRAMQNGGSGAGPTALNVPSASLFAYLRRMLDGAAPVGLPLRLDPRATAPSHSSGASGPGDPPARDRQRRQRALSPPCSRRQHGQPARQVQMGPGLWSGGIHSSSHWRELFRMVRDLLAAEL